MLGTRHGLLLLLVNMVITPSCQLDDVRVVSDLEHTLLRCPGKGQGTRPPVPVSRHYRLRAEPKTGTTWFQRVVFDLLLEICEKYDAAVEDVTCVATCASMNSHVEQPGCGLVECPLRNLCLLYTSDAADE